ncbi:hypothetical protein GOODEAATRI_029707, partial [Goodea atripinnis]
LSLHRPITEIPFVVVGTQGKALLLHISSDAGKMGLVLFLCNLASNGGQSSDYSSSLPSTPVISHKEIARTLRGEKGDSGVPGSVRSVRKRTPRFVVSAAQAKIFHFSALFSK